VSKAKKKKEIQQKKENKKIKMSAEKRKMAQRGVRKGGIR
jgi:hypothetical protein